MENKISPFRLKIRSLFCRHRRKIFTGRYKIETGMVPLCTYGLAAEFYCYHCGKTKWGHLGEKEIFNMGPAMVMFQIMYDRCIFTFAKKITPEDYISAKNWDDFFANHFSYPVLPFKLGENDDH